MERTELFRSDLFKKSNVGTTKQRDDALNQILQERKNDPQGILFSNKGCWRSMFNLDNIDWLTDEVINLCNSASLTYSEHSSLYKEKIKNLSNMNYEYWSNVNEKYSRNSMHAHANKWQYSAIYYLNVENTGNLLFHNPANILPICEPMAPFIDILYVEPKDGDLLLWPAWIPHEVEPNLSNKNRINIAFNLSLVGVKSNE